jgi:hypothetical protein
MQDNLSLPFQTLSEVKRLGRALSDPEHPPWCQYMCLGLYFKQRIWKDYDDFKEKHIPYVKQATRIWDIDEFDEFVGVDGVPNSGHCMLLTKFAQRKVQMIDNRIMLETMPVGNYIYLGRGQDGNHLQI